MLNNLFIEIDQHYDEMVNMRRYLHQYPELSFYEYKTAAFIAEHYQRLEIPYQANVGGNGVVATLTGGKPGKTIALRADFDGLPIQDEKKGGISFQKSRCDARLWPRWSYYDTVNHCKNI